MDYLYKKFAKYYDLCYSGKDYVKETNFIQDLIKKYKIEGRRLLEVGCGTGGHALHLQKKGFDIVGIDLNKEMLDIAKKKSRSILFLQGDMKNFNIGEKFDIILCLFSTTHYNQNIKDLKRTLKNFYTHLKKGGLLIFDMGFNEERWKKRWENSAANVENWSNKEVDLVRFSKPRRQGQKGILDMAYILFKDKKFYFGKEKHILGIFKTLDVKKLTKQLGFKTDLYENYTLTPWKKSSRKYVVFGCIKK